MIAITALEVAFISAIAAVTAAVAAPISAWLVARANNRHDRWVKLYGDLRAAYSGLLREIIVARRAILLLARAYEKGDPGMYQSTLKEDETVQVERQALVSSLASRRVGDALDEWETAWRGNVLPIFETLGDATHEERLRSAETLRACLEAVDGAWHELLDAIRDDLRAK